MRRMLARFALVLSLAVAGWALGEAIASRVAATAASPASALPAGGVAAGSRAVALDSGLSGKKSEGARRVSKRPAAETSSNSGDFLRANAPVVIPAGVSEIGLESAGEVAATENRPAPSRAEREAPSPGAPPAPEALAPVVGAAPDSPLGDGASAEDAAITVEVRRKLESAAPGRRIQVSTRHGVVTLSGAVDTEQEKSEAIESARKTPGVSRVEDRLVVLVS
jgi:hyperosmotically inducible periplasmic protein